MLRWKNLFLLMTVSAAFAAAPAPSKWEAEIKAFETAHQTNPPPANGILFVGSSSIRLWKTLAQDFPELPVINRGFGGSQIVDSTHFAPRIIFPSRPRMIVLYAGDNDIAAGKSPEQVLADFKEFVGTVRAKLPESRIAFISIKPSPSRWHLADKVKQANALIEEYCRSGNQLTFIDVFREMLGTDGQPRAELFVQDRLHLNEQGYALWRRLVQPHLK
jgi:lysophospholipase L1-like esterase